VIPVHARSITARAYRTGTAQNVPDIETDPDCLEASLMEEAEFKRKPEFAVPILYNGEVVGIINIESRVQDAYMGYDVGLVETLANHATAALRRISSVNNYRHGHPTSLEAPVTGIEIQRQ
jgi:GAF domain-containing protein